MIINEWHEVRYGQKDTLASKRVKRYVFGKTVVEHLMSNRKYVRAAYVMFIVVA